MMRVVEMEVKQCYKYGHFSLTQSHAPKQLIMALFTRNFLRKCIWPQWPKLPHIYNAKGMSKYGLMVSPAGLNELDYINILSGGNRSHAGDVLACSMPALATT